MSNYKLNFKLYQQMTDNNQHGKVLEKIASDVKTEQFVKIFRSINKTHETEGYLSSDLQDVRHHYHVEFMKHLKSILSEKEFDQICECL